MPSFLHRRSIRGPSERRVGDGRNGLSQRVLRRAREAVLRDPETLGELLRDERTLKLILHESRIANRILTDPRSIARVVGEADFLATLADSDSLLDYLRRHQHLLSRLLDDGELIAKIAEDPRLKEYLLRDQSTLAVLLDDERASTLFASDKERLSRITDGDDFAELLMNDPDALSRVISQPPLRETLASHPALLEATIRSTRGGLKLREALLSDPESLERIATDDRTLRKLIEHTHTLDRILLSDRARVRMRSSRRFLDQLIDDPGFIAELFLDARVVKKLMSNRMLLRGLLQEEDVQTAVLECMPSAPATPNETEPSGAAGDESASLVDLLQSPEIARVFSEDEELLGGLLANPALRERIVAHPLLRETQASGATPTRANDRVREIALPAVLPLGTTRDEATLARMELARYWNEFVPHLDPRHRDTEARFEHALGRLESRDQIPDTLEQILGEDGEVHLCEGVFNLLPGSRLPELLYQVLVAERYAFTAATEAPRILDCGSQAGLATFGWKRLYPNARITTVEPAPALRQAARANLKSMGHDDIEHLAHAISPERTSLPFLLGSDGRGGKLIPVAASEPVSGKCINVRARPLSDLLRDPVDLLKLDIAGAEAGVLENAEAELANVRQLFVEVHDCGDDFGARIARLFAVLKRSGFETSVKPRLGPIRPNRDGQSVSSSFSREAFGIAARRLG
ncbi:MAG: FkbM family methyltransferase [bacterium]|nr:FkbM family methyltransferase [bacterium]